MNPVFEKVKKSYDYIRTVTDFTPEVALVLGSGLGEFAKHMEVDVRFHTQVLRDSLYQP